MNSFNYLTCRELLEKYPSVKLWGWNPNKIGVFYNCLLLDGRRFGKNSRPIITESSFLELISYARSAVEVADQDPEFLSYDEVLELIPQAELYRWTPTVIGMLFHSGLLSGIKSKKEQKCLVTKASVIRLIQYTGQRFIDIANKPFK